MAKNIINKREFTFRKKFEKYLTDEKRGVIEASFQVFCDLNPGTARFLLWKMPIDADSAAKAVEMLGISLDVIPFEDIMVYRNELRYQYEQLSPDFLQVFLPDSCKAAYQEVVNHTDTIVANMVYEKLEPKLHMEEVYVSKIMELLESDVEKRFCGGLHEAGFSWREVAYLKNYHLQVHALLKALHEDKQKRDISCKNMPFADLAEKIQEAGKTIPKEVPKKQEEKVSVASYKTEDDKTEGLPLADEPETAEECEPSTESEEATAEYQKLTAEAVLKHLVPFACFVGGDMNSLLKLGNLGFNLNEVDAKKAAIRDLITAANAVNS